MARGLRHASWPSLSMDDRDQTAEQAAAIGPRSSLTAAVSLLRLQVQGHHPYLFFVGSPCCFEFKTVASHHSYALRARGRPVGGRWPLLLLRLGASRSDDRGFGRRGVRSRHALAPPRLRPLGSQSANLTFLAGGITNKIVKWPAVCRLLVRCSGLRHTNRLRPSSDCTIQQSTNPPLWPTTTRQAHAVLLAKWPSTTGLFSSTPYAGTSDNSNQRLLCATATQMV